jgi:hypothetical protein
MDDMNSATRSSTIIVFKVDEMRNVMETLHLDHNQDGGAVKTREAHRVDVVRIAKGRDGVHDVFTAPMLQREVLNGERHKRLMLEDKPVSSLIKVL